MRSRIKPPIMDASIENIKGCLPMKFFSFLSELDDITDLLMRLLSPIEILMMNISIFYIYIIILEKRIVYFSYYIG